MGVAPHLLLGGRGTYGASSSVVYSLAGATRVDGHGETPRGSEDVVISWLCSSTGTTNGIMTFAPFGEKARCRTDDYELVSARQVPSISVEYNNNYVLISSSSQFFYVLGGELLVEVNSQEFLLRPQTEAVVPAGQPRNYFFVVFNFMTRIYTLYLLLLS